MKLHAVAGAALASAVLTSFPGAATPPTVPYTLVTIAGNQSIGVTGSPVTYRAYQAPGETFRIVCQEPCAVAENLIFAAYAGFRPAKQQLVALAGIDSLPALQPFDIHLNGDSWCGPYNYTLSGDAGQYCVPGVSCQGSFGCFWDVEKALPNQSGPYLPTPFDVDIAQTIQAQLLRVHEYGHTLFYGRHFYSYEDFVKAYSFYISSINGRFITDACDPYLDGFSQGRLVFELCHVAGFHFSDFAPTLQQLDQVFHAGQGDSSYGLTSVAQFQKILSTHLGKSTVDAFLGSALTPSQGGDSGTLAPAGGVLRFAEGNLSLRAPVGAVSSPLAISLGAITSAPAGFPVNFDFNYSYELSPASATFNTPVALTIRYDPFFLHAAEGTLRVYRISGNNYLELPSSVNVTDGTVTANISSLGTYFLAGPSPAAGPASVLSTVASTSGLLGSFYKTGLQLHNPLTSSVSGKLVFHTTGASGSDSDVAYAYTLGSRQTKSVADLLPAMSQSGNGSVDVVATTGPAPLLVTRVFNDAGAAGTSGMTEDPVKPDAALQAGDRGVILVPPSLAIQRINIGIRTLASGATISVTVRAPSGSVLKQLTKTYPPTFHQQTSAAVFLENAALSGSESLEITVTAGSLVVYGASSDNTTQDPSLQIARRLPSGPVASEPLTLVTVASTSGLLGSFFRTGVQLHNPDAAPISGTIVFHPKGAAGSPGDPSLPYTLAARETRSFADLLPAMSQSGSGSVDIVPVSGSAPAVVARVFNDGGAAGTAGFTEEARTRFGALLPGEHAVILMPPDLVQQRINIGVRTLSHGAQLTVHVWRPDGSFKAAAVLKTYPADFYNQTSAADFVGPTITLAANESIDILVDDGSLFVYGASTDNVTQDPSLQLARRVPLF